MATGERASLDAEFVTAALRDTQAAFDSVAADYDGVRGNNELVQCMRREMWHWLDAVFPTNGRLIDLGCGTGLDAVRMAARGHRITATDWSPEMVQRTRARAERAGVATLCDPVAGSVDAAALGAHELHRLGPDGGYDGAYSNLGPLNCVPDTAAVARECARLLKPGGALVFTVIGRVCPWEIAHYFKAGRWARVKVRFARGAQPVRMNGRTVWTHYYRPGEFYRAFAPYFSLQHHRGLCLWAPPPYLTGVRDRHPGWYERLWRWDRRCAGWPLIRALGDHFLMVLRKR